MKEQLIITEKEVGERLDKVLVEQDASFSRQQIQTWIKEAYVKVNGKDVKANYRCRLHDELVWEFPLEDEEKRKLHPENIPLTISYEDESILVIDKPKGMLVHPTQTVREGTLVNALLYHYDNLSTISGEDRPGIVHRLDQQTSGIMLIAKDDVSHQHLTEQFKARTVKRIYEALVYGVMQHDNGIIQAPIGRHPKNRLKRAVVENGKEAETHFQVLEYFQDYTHVQCELITGRTHQIRVHLKYMNHPIVGDIVYTRRKQTFNKGQALFARELSFDHPVRGERMTFTVERPTYFQKILDKLRK